MSNKRAPSELQRYVISQTEKINDGKRTTYHYTKTQAEAKKWRMGKPGKFMLFKISYDHIGEI